MLPKNYRLRKRTEFAYSYKHGKNYNFNGFNLVVYKRKDNLLRIGFSVSKKIGKAHVRNKIKRQLRALIHKEVNLIKKGYNLIFIAKPQILNLSFLEIKNEINVSLIKCLLK